jgi:iron complex outermembrane receptor protein
LEDTAAAAYVITSEDIRRSGATNLPDALRLVPGVNVAQISASEWAISIRGFNDQFSNKLQVLVDGRSVYTPLFSGVFWDEQNVLMQDIERIEVIRGPGGATWGANAVNGVINIITKQTRATLGSMVSSVVGSRQYELAGRTGFAVGENTYGRVYAKGFYQRPFADNNPPGLSDSNWRGGLFGFRTDTTSEDTSVMLAGHFFKEELDNRQPLTAHLSAVFEREHKGDTHTLKGYLYHFDIGTWDTSVAVTEGGTTAANLDYSWKVRELGMHKTTVGASYQMVYARAVPTFPPSFGQVSGSTHLFGGFIQDDMSLSDNLQLTVGVKLEHNSYTGFEYQPSARLRWSDGNHGAFWLAASRAVRTPSIFEDGGAMQDTRAPSAATGYLPVTLLLHGNEQLKAETVLSYEAGYRKNVSQVFGIDLAVFTNYYDNLRTLNVGPLFPQFTPPLPFPTSLYAEVTTGNTMRARTQGVEVAADYRPTDAIKLQASYSWLEIQVREKTGNADTTIFAEERKSPRHQASLAAYYTLSDQWEVDMQLRYVGDLPSLDVKEYLTGDVRIAWQAAQGIELSLVGRNLFSAKHREFGQAGLASSTAYRIPREAYVSMNWYF